jgi:hypothetical protein
LIKEGQEINLRMDDYPYMDYGIVQGKISSLSGIRHIDNSAYIPVALSDERNAVKQQDLLSGMKGDGDIVLTSNFVSQFSIGYAEPCVSQFIQTSA